jgi:hypothetical protein
MTANTTTQKAVGATDHRDGYQRIKANLQALEGVTRLAVAQHG